MENFIQYFNESGIIYSVNILMKDKPGLGGLKMNQLVSYFFNFNLVVKKPKTLDHLDFLFS